MEVDDDIGREIWETGIVWKMVLASFIYRPGLSRWISVKVG